MTFSKINLTESNIKLNKKIKSQNNRITKKVILRKEKIKIVKMNNLQKKENGGNKEK